MKVQLIGNNQGQQALAAPGVRREINRLKKMLQSVPQLEWPYKSRKQPGLRLLQPALNTWISQELEELGWTANSPLLLTEGHPHGRRVDFIKFVGDGATRIIVQVQFGNSGRMYADFYKFLTAHSAKELTLGVMITLTKPTAKITDTGIVTFESVAEHMTEGADAAVRFPFVCLGLTHCDNPENTIDFSKGNFDNSRISMGTGIKKALGTIIQTLRKDRTTIAQSGIRMPRARVRIRQPRIEVQNHKSQ
ncbi:MAG: hypothetical protein Q7U16_12905 [Agitococcus sp.]|nr:hypothetical protein [Agitococcus sp.]